MTTLTPASTSADTIKDSSGPWHDLRSFWRDFIATAFRPYRPELHYMRGPGPAWRAKHGERLPPRSR